MTSIFEEIKSAIYEDCLGDYIVKQTIGKGTFSKVKLGIHKKTKQNVAIKILEKSKIVEKDDLERIIREMSIIQELDHNNIVKVHEMFESEDNFLIIMDYCEGGEWFNYIVNYKSWGEEETAYFFYQIINAIEYIHSKGIVHRDLKPENWLWDKDKNLKWIDFGLSNYYSDKYLSTPCGSPCYASPEMVSGNKYNGFYIDVWSTGIIVFAMLCGYLPFEDPDNNGLFKKILECKIHYPSHWSDLSKDIMKRILVTNPEKRIKIPDIKKHQFYILGKKAYNHRFGIKNDDDTENMLSYYQPTYTDGNMTSIGYGGKKNNSNNLHDYFNNVSKWNHKIGRIKRINIVVDGPNAKAKGKNKYNNSIVNHYYNNNLNNWSINKTISTQQTTTENTSLNYNHQTTKSNYEIVYPKQPLCQTPFENPWINYHIAMHSNTKQTKHKFTPTSTSNKKKKNYKTITNGGLKVSTNNGKTNQSVFSYYKNNLAFLQATIASMKGAKKNMKNINGRMKNTILNTRNVQNKALNPIEIGNPVLTVNPFEHLNISSINKVNRQTGLSTFANNNIDTFRLPSIKFLENKPMPWARFVRLRVDSNNWKDDGGWDIKMKQKKQIKKMKVHDWFGKKWNNTNVSSHNTSLGKWGKNEYTNNGNWGVFVRNKNAIDITKRTEILGNKEIMWRDWYVRGVMW